jgi:hypothetical protein
LVKFKKHIIDIGTDDGIVLSAIVLKPLNPKGVIQINSAAAVVPKEFYLGIASYFVENS